MNDLKTLHDAWEAPEPPSQAAFTEARARLLVRAAGSATASERTRRAPRLGVRRASLAGIAVLAVATFAVIQNLGGSSGGAGSVVPGMPRIQNASAEVLNRAADEAGAQPFTAPRDDQWIFTEDKLSGSGDKKGITRAEWHRADGNGFAIEQDGELKLTDVPRKHDGQRGRRRAPQTFDSFTAVSQLPIDPDELRRWAYGFTDHVEGAGSSVDAEVFNILRRIIGIGVLPPDLLSAAYRAMAQVPGVTVKEVEVNGDPTLAVGQTDDWLNQELLLDKRTYEFRGQISTVVKDTVVSKEKADNSGGEVKTGHEVVSARLRAGIVNEPGERP